MRPAGSRSRIARDDGSIVGYVPGTFVVNIGDLMMQWTNDTWISTVHRVVNPTRDRGLGARRISMVFFHQPNYDAEIACLEACLSADRLPKYAPITSGGAIGAPRTQRRARPSRSRE